MSVRRYTARDMRDAMRQVRELQGPDAVILSSRRVDGMLEVIAALDEGDQAAAPAPTVPTRAPHRERANAPEVRAPRPAVPATATLPTDPEIAAMRRELCDLRSLLVQHQNASESARWAARHPLAAELVTRLTGCGFTEKLARSLAGGILEETSVESAWSRLRARLSAAMPTAQSPVLDQGGMLALVGPTGVGKTTTLARLALRQIRRMGRDSVSLVSLDRQRIGAYKQLQAFGQMAGVSVMLLENEHELAALSSRAGDGRLILIDTAGHAARDAAERRLFAQVRERIELETWLVIAATHQSMVLRQVLEAFQSSEPSALVLTKVDETEQLGETLSVLMEQRLGLIFYSDGQRMTEDFHKVDTLYLTRLALQERVHAMRAPSGARASLDGLAMNAMPASTRTPGEQGGMVLESVLPFRTPTHATA
ncbi:flagellar biosynthetic protein FlhF [Marichromatium purpuratum 984]|uniref:Flagellar biosynthesis protein FlhF n=1 Tax=Marichromatium purpuratum 984 TaxID=765910 RepID=W0E2A2_MARPU|nr:flagellar biosynthesis protein FlhF [Marichromatium purpuratum]AHF03643.1 flagellar biosynthetic protein FlhF [Marichromatium purpuratum 984]